MQEKSKIKNFRDLEVWQLAMEIVTDSYKYTKSFSREEMYGLINQIRRAALSIASNIAVGSFYILLSARAPNWKRKLRLVCF